MDVESNYRDTIIMSKVSCLMDYSYLTAKDKEGKLPPEAKGQHLLWVVEKYQEFENNLKENGIEYVELSVDEEEFDRIRKEKPQQLLEKKEVEKDNYVIKIRSNENTNHYLPHVHVELTDGSSASISIDDDFKIFDCYGKAKHKDYKKAVLSIKKHLQKLRAEWNNFSMSQYKFNVINGKYVCK